MSFTSSYVMAGIGTFFILFWLFLYIKYRNAYDHNESGEVNMVAIVLIIIVVIALVAVFKDGISDVLSAAFKKIKEAIETL